jgi:hypothetical protein
MYSLTRIAQWIIDVVSLIEHVNFIHFGPGTLVAPGGILCVYIHTIQNPTCERYYRCVTIPRFASYRLPSKCAAWYVGGGGERALGLVGDGDNKPTDLDWGSWGDGGMAGLME